MRAVTWSPEGFEQYRELYPRTGALDPHPDPIWSSRFAEIWHRGMPSIKDSLAALARDTTVVFVRGFLGHYMPGNLTAPCASLRRLGFDTFIAGNRAGGTVAGNVAAIARQLGKRPLRERMIFCGHSRGGFECLSLLARHPAIAKRCFGVVLSHTAHGPSYVLESVLQGLHRENGVSPRRRLSEACQRGALLVAGASRGGYELTSAIWPALVGSVDSVRWAFPVLQTASWSSQPTAWLDSFHARLSEIGPGRAHDGQFFLEDLLWPALPHVLLPHLDHAQTAVGGYGFDNARYWLANISLVSQ
jgi:pimeloyl-ACP methyl ester carboxylesterase